MHNCLVRESFIHYIKEDQFVISLVELISYVSSAFKRNILDCSDWISVHDVIL